VSLNGLRDDGSIKADPGDEQNFYVKDNPFAFSPGQLSKLFNPISLAAFALWEDYVELRWACEQTSPSVDETTLDGTVKSLNTYEVNLLD